MKCCYTVLVCLLAIASVGAQFGRRNRQQQDQADGRPAPSDIDLAMAGWEQLGKNPGSISQVIEGLKDPEVMAKAQEMLKDPHYMAAAKSKLAELEAKAKARGMLDENGMPVPGAAAAAALGGGSGGGGMAAEAAEWELKNIARHQAGQLNTAELGMAQLKGAMQDPGAMQNVMQMMQDPATRAEVEAMMNDPAFKAQAQQVMAGVKEKMAQMNPDQMAQMARSMGLEVTPEQMAQAKAQLDGLGGARVAGGMGGLGSGGAGGASELERLRAENAAMRQHLKAEL